MLKLMFPDPKHLEDVLDIGRMGTIVRTPVGGGGGMVAQLTQAGAIIDLAIAIVCKNYQGHLPAIIAPHEG